MKSEQAERARANATLQQAVGRLVPQIQSTLQVSHFYALAYFHLHF